MIRIALSAIALLVASAAQAQVYKCVDSSGKFTYSQNPCPPSTKRESMSRGGIPPASAAAPAAAAADKAGTSGAAKSAPKTPAEREQDSRKSQQDQAKASKEAEQKAADAQAKEANCRNARQRLTQFEIGGRISHINDKGERYYMEDAQIESEKARARGDVAQFCN